MALTPEIIDALIRSKLPVTYRNPIAKTERQGYVVNICAVGGRPVFSETLDTKGIGTICEVSQITLVPHFSLNDPVVLAFKDALNPYAQEADRVASDWWGTGWRDGIVGFSASKNILHAAYIEGYGVGSTCLALLSKKAVDS